MKLLVPVVVVVVVLRGRVELARAWHVTVNEREDLEVKRDVNGRRMV